MAHDSPEAVNNFQQDIYNISKWSNMWKMALNCRKCKIMHYGKKNQQVTYYILDEAENRIELLNSKEERDLGIIVTIDSKWHKHVTTIANRANKILGLLNNTFTNKDTELYKLLYTCYVRPLLEFAAPVWNPHHKGDIKILERIQQRATKIPNDLRKLPYEGRLNKLGLQRLSERRQRGDCIQLYKCINGADKINWSYPLKPAASLSKTGPASSIRGHQKRMQYEATKNSVRDQFFTNRASRVWNTLGEELVEAKSLNEFKAKYDKIFIK